MGQQSGGYGMGYQPYSGYGNYGGSQFPDFVGNSVRGNMASPTMGLPWMGQTQPFQMSGSYMSPQYPQVPTEPPYVPTAAPSYWTNGGPGGLPLSAPSVPAPTNPLARPVTPNVSNGYTSNPAMPNPLQTAQNTQGLTPAQIAMGTYITPDGRVSF